MCVHTDAVGFWDVGNMGKLNYWDVYVRYCLPKAGYARWDLDHERHETNEKCETTDAGCVTAQIFVTFADVRDIRGPSFPVGTNPFGTAHLP